MEFIRTGFEHIGESLTVTGLIECSFAENCLSIPRLSVCGLVFLMWYRNTWL